MTDTSREIRCGQIDCIESCTSITLSTLAAGSVATNSELAIDATWLHPDQADALLILAHGAGADHRHKNMSGIAEACARQRVATLRFNFPFMQANAAGRRRPPDRPEVAMRCIAQVLAYAQQQTALPIFLGGHSFGGRMTTHAVLEQALDCLGLVLCSFPLHTPKKQDIARAAHLGEVKQPMLFLSGSRDDMADTGLIREVVAGLEHAQLHLLDTANHSYVPLKRTRVHPLPVFDEMAEQVRLFIDRFA